MSKSIKRTLRSVVVAMMLATALSVAFVFAETIEGTAFAMDVYANVEGVDNQITPDVEPSDTIAWIKTAIYNETGIAVDRLTISFNDEVLSNDDSALADYNIRKWSVLTVAVAPLAEPTIYDGGESTLTNNNDNYEIFTIQETEPDFNEEPEVNEEPEGNEEPEQQE